METLKPKKTVVLAFLSLLFVTACGGKDDEGQPKASFPSKTYVCEDRDENTRVILTLTENPDEKYFGDLVASATIESEGLKVEIGLMLAMSFRGRRGEYEIRRALVLRDLDGPVKDSNILVVENAEEAPLMMTLDKERSELAIHSRPLKRLVRFGLEAGRAFQPRRVPDVGEPRPDEDGQPYFLDCSVR